MARASALFVLGLVAGCATRQVDVVPTPGRDAGGRDGGAADTGVRDAGPLRDTGIRDNGVSLDSGAMPDEDAGETPEKDAGAPAMDVPRAPDVWRFDAGTVPDLVTARDVPPVMLGDVWDTPRDADTTPGTRTSPPAPPHPTARRASAEPKTAPARRGSCTPRRG